MSHLIKRKQKERKEKSAKEDATTTNEKATFSYTVARILKRQKNNFAWTVIEKGYNKSNPGQEYEISFRTIKLAASQIRRHVLKTPCYKSQYLLNKDGFNIYFKKEHYQLTESIKARGVVYTLLQLSDEQKRKGVIAISTGNFAFILCHYGHKFRIPVTVVLPTSTADEKIELCKHCRQFTESRISVVVQGNNMLEAHKIALHIAKTKGLFYLDGNNHPNMIIGQATLGLEIMKQEREIDTVLLPTTIDGCGLAIAIATVIKEQNSKVKIIEIQSQYLDPLFQNVIKQTDLPNELEIRTREYIACPLRNLPSCVIDRIIQIGQSLVRSASDYLHEAENYYDQYGAIAFAPILFGLLDELKGKRVVIPLFGKMDSIKDFARDRRRL